MGRRRGVGGAVFCLLLVSALSMSNAQLLGADECSIGYQYRSPRSSFRCRANVTVNRLECWVAIPPLPPDTRAEVIWYRRSRLSEAEHGSDVAVTVENQSPFSYRHVVCDRSEFCPSSVNNLTVYVNRLIIDDFNANLEGDYLCQVVLVNETSQIVQELETSNCARLQVASSDQALECDMSGEHPWSCADQDLRTDLCPQQLLRLIAPSSSFMQQTSSRTLDETTIVMTTPFTFKSTMTTPITINPTMSPPLVSSDIHSIASPISTQPGARDIESTSHIYTVLGVLVGLLVISICVAAFIILGLWCIKHRRSTSFKVEVNGRAPSYVITTKEGGIEDSGKTSNTTLNRVSTLYSKPHWPNDLEPERDLIKEHHYATIPAQSSGEATDVDMYSYAYQHCMNSAVELVSSKQANESGKGKGVYQPLGSTDYMHMYSKPSPLLVGVEQRKTPPTQDEVKGYKELSTATLEPDSIYTKPGQEPEKLE